MELYQKQLQFINANLYGVMESIRVAVVIVQTEVTFVRWVGLKGQPNFSIATALVGML